MLKQKFLALLVAGSLLAPAAWAQDDDAGMEWQVGDLSVSAAYARATLPNAPVAGAYMSIRNNGTQDDRLLDVSTDVAEKAEIHEMQTDGEVMTMHELPDGLPLPAGERVDLTPGGVHLMFLRLKQPLVEGEQVDVTLRFQQAGEVTLPVQIGPFNAGGDAMGGHMHHGAAGGAHAGH